MKKISKLTLTLAFLCLSYASFSQSWVDSVDLNGREVFMPADKYKWDWGQATFLNSLIHLYNTKSEADKKIYFDYVKKAMETTSAVANGKHPNAVASAHGIAFLARITGDKNYINKANGIYADYLNIPRASNGGVSHRAETVELWDDTVYMLSMFLLEMYRLTGDEKYVANFVEQFDAHNKELTDKKTGLWVHGWDADSVFYDDGCSIKNWPDKITHRNDQIWARGNGWVGMALSDALETVGRSSKFWKPLEKAFVHYVQSVAPFQDKSTGHWYQLVTLPNEPRNYLESSATAMYAYTIVKGLQLNILNKKKYFPMVQQSYNGLRAMSIRNTSGAYLVPTRVSGGTCVGDKEYYLNRKIGEGTGFGFGSFIMFGLAYEQYTGLRK
jgi:unsaturated rhamnogalacturonyl hydrolase